MRPPLYAYVNAEFASEHIVNGKFTVASAASIMMADGLVLDMGLRAADINKAEPFVSFCREANRDIIALCPINPARPDEDLLARLLGWTRRLELGNTRGGEFAGGVAEAHAYYSLAKERGFEWICGLTPWSLADDFKHRGNGMGLCEFLTSCGTLSISHTAYVMAGELFADPQIPDMASTSMAKRKLVAEGMTPDLLAEFMAPHNIWSAVGRQAGLDVGVHRYMQRLGFKGFIVGIPFVLPKDLH